MGLTWLDLKLAVRMLVRYPGLTFVGLAGITTGIVIAAGAFGILYRFTDPALPLEDGNRIVTILQLDTAANRRESRILHDFTQWRNGLKTVEQLGAFRQVTRNLIAPGGQPEAVRVAEITAAGFTVPRVVPLLGRYLTAADERLAAPDVVVIGFDAWRNRFEEDPAILGRTVRLGDVHYTVVGAMPEGFKFPISDDYQAWDAFRISTANPGFAAGEFLTTFIALDPGTAMSSATSEDQIASRYAGRHDELVRRLEADPAIADVTFMSNLPGEEPTAWIEVDGVRSPSAEEAESGSGSAARSGSAAGQRGPIQQGRRWALRDARRAGTDRPGVRKARCECGGRCGRGQCVVRGEDPRGRQRPRAAAALCGSERRRPRRESRARTLV